MKRLLLIPGIAALSLLCSPTVHGQAPVKENTATTPAPTEVTGTVAEWRPDSVTILQKDATSPLRFSFAKKVEYVDAAGKAVSREMVSPGVPVTMRYTREGDQMLVNRVIVQHPLTLPSPAPATAATTETPPAKPNAGHAAKEIEKLRGTVQQEERQLSEHPK
jgi:hypothetical protein